MSPPPKKEFWIDLSFPRVLTDFLVSGTWRVFTDCPSVSCTQGVLTDCLVCAAPEECSLIIWGCGVIKLKNGLTYFYSSGSWQECLLIVQCQLYPKSINCLPDLCCTWMVFIDPLVVLCNEILKSIYKFCQLWYLKSVYWLSYAVLYLKKVNWSNSSHQMSPPPKKEFRVFLRFLRVLTDFFMLRYLKSVYWLSSVSCTQGVLTDCLVCVLPKVFSLICFMVLYNET